MVQLQRAVYLDTALRAPSALAKQTSKQLSNFAQTVHRVVDQARPAVPGLSVCKASATTAMVDERLNPRVTALKPSKTMALTDLASSMRDAGEDIIGLAAGEPDFDTPDAILDAGIEALRYVTAFNSPYASSPVEQTTHGSL